MRASLLPALILLAAGRTAAAPADAPLGVDTPGPIRGLFLDLPLDDARGTVDPGLEVRVWSANSWSVPTRLVRGDRVAVVEQDAQTEALVLRLALPGSRLGHGALADRLSTTLEARLLRHWGGFTDGGIEAWHELVGSWNFLRERYARDRIALRIGEDGRPAAAAIGGPRTALGDVALRTALRLAGGGDGARWAVALRLDVKAPIGAFSRFAGSGGWDAGVGLAATAAPTPRFTFHGLASLRAISPLPAASPLQPRPLQAGLDLSIVFRATPRVALLLESRVASPLLRPGWELAPGAREPEATALYALFRPHNQISGGVRVGDVTLFFSEDFTPGRRSPGDPGPRWFYNSAAPDIVVGVSWARRFPER